MHFTASSGQNWTVIRRSVAATVLVAFLATGTAAAEQPKPKPSKPMKQMQMSPAGDMEQRMEAIRAINKAFSDAVRQAQRVYKAARDAARSAEARSKAEVDRRASIAAAAIARQKAIDALGPLPRKP